VRRARGLCVLPMKQPARPTVPTALVVDDNPRYRALAAGTLRQRGLEPIVARDGFEAISLLSRRPRGLALVIVDTEMPGVHGWEVIRFARNTAPSTPIIRLGRPDDEVPGAEYRTLVAIPVLAKPFTGAELLASLGRRLRTGP
jgi:DNA-binding response OmpR family regulator